MAGVGDEIKAGMGAPWGLGPEVHGGVVVEKPGG